MTLLVPSLVMGSQALSAQGGEWPSLSRVGLEYVSRSGFLQVSLSGQLDLEAMQVHNSWTGLTSREGGEAPIDDASVRCLRCHVEMGPVGDGGTLTAHRLRVFADIFLGDQVYSLIEVRSDRGEAPTDGPATTRLEQAYVRFSSESGSGGLQVGRFVSPFGSYPMRHLTVVDPFIRPPLAYDYRTIVSPTLMPDSAATFLRWKERPHVFRETGAPPVWGVPYQWGGMLFQGVGPIDVRVAVVNSAASSAPESWDLNWGGLEHPSVVAGLSMQPSASLGVGLSYGRGPWMERISRDDPPDGWVPPPFTDYHQELISADLTWSRGPLLLRGEAILDRWEVPEVEDRPTERIFSAELQYDLWAGVSVAGRLGYIDFRPLDDGVGGRDDWDYDVYRYEASIGYRLARNAGILLSGFRQIQRTAEDGDTHLIGARLWWAF